MSHPKSKKRGIWWGGGGLRKATRESPDLSQNAKYRNQLSRLDIKKGVWNILLYIRFCSQQINWKPAPGGRYFDKLFGGEEAPRPETNIICWYLFCKSICGLSWEIVERFVARNISQIYSEECACTEEAARSSGFLFPFKRRMPNSQLQNLNREMSWFETNKNEKQLSSCYPLQ